MSDLGDRLHGGLKRVLADAEESAKATGRSIADTFADDQSGNRNWRVLVFALADWLAVEGPITRKDAKRLRRGLLQGDSLAKDTSALSGGQHLRLYTVSGERCATSTFPPS